MNYEKLHLKDWFPMLGEDARDPVVTIYRPNNMICMGRQNQKRPCIVICPGGSYCSLSEREADPVALQFLSKGFHVFVLTYSVAPHRFPTQLREVAAVLELIHKCAEQWNCDPQRVAIMGFSAGGHLVANYTNSYDCPEVRQVFPDSHPVKAAILCYPVITAQPQFAHLDSIENLTGESPLTESSAKKFSLENCVTAKTPPTFLWHTAADAGVPVENSLLYAAALSKNKIPFELHVYPYGGHGMATADEQTCDGLTKETAHVHAWLDAAQKWLEIEL